MHKTKLVALVLAATTAALVSSVNANPNGTVYTMQLHNLPASVDPMDIKFDMFVEVIFPDGEEVTISETALELDYGQLFEFSVETLFPTPLAFDVESASSMSITGLHTNGSQGAIAANSAYIYFSVDGDAEPLDGGTRHPLDANVDVIMLGNPPSAFANDLTFELNTATLTPEGTMASLLESVGLEFEETTGIHVGFLVDSGSTVALPEPSAGSLFGVGALALLRLRRRRWHS